MGNTVNQQQLLQALAQRMAMMRGPGSMSGIPGAGTPSQPSPAPSQPDTSPQGGMPGAASAPQPQGQAPARQLSPASPTPFNGTFGGRQGIISQLVNSAEKRGHDKKVNEAEMYYNQINSFLASGKPDDQQRAQQLLDDPKVRKILKTGLDYVPLEEEVPPEAIGVHQAQQKINQKQSVIGQLKQMLSGGRQQGSAQPRPQGKAIVPGPSQASQQAYSLGEAKIGEQEALAEQHKATALAEKQKADAETMKAEAEKIKALDEIAKNKAIAEEARSHAKLYESQAKDASDTSPQKKREFEAHANEMDAMARYHDAMAKYVSKGGKLPGSALQSQIKSARGDMVSLLRGYISDNKDAAKAVSKDTGYLFGPRSGLLQQQQDASKKSKDMTQAISWFDGEGTTAVTEGKMSLPEAVNKAYRMAGIEPPTPSMGPTEGGEEPERPQGVPPEAQWEPSTGHWVLE